MGKCSVYSLSLDSLRNYSKCNLDSAGEMSGSRARFLSYAYKFGVADGIRRTIGSSTRRRCRAPSRYNLGGPPMRKVDRDSIESG